MGITTCEKAVDQNSMVPNYMGHFRHSSKLRVFCLLPAIARWAELVKKGFLLLQQLQCKSTVPYSVLLKLI